MNLLSKKSLLITLVLLIANISLLAQPQATCPTPLSWDFPNVPYKGVYEATVVLSLFPPCKLTYKYCWRTTPAFYDFAICEVSLEGSGCNESTPIDSLIRYASRDLITNINPWGGKR